MAFDEWEREESVTEEIKLIGFDNGAMIICKYSEKGDVAIIKQPMTWFINPGPQGQQMLQLGDWIPGPLYDKKSPLEISKSKILFVTGLDEGMARNYQQMTSSIHIPNATQQWEDVERLAEGKIIG
tara:strand:- start:3690 stop:4067 length:378 start_codon:yes stop_codon:yes gene_type:complete